jgi:hypothetical protein
MSVSAFADRASLSAPADRRDHQRVPGDSARELALLVIPSRGGNGFRASVRGHLLELADPDSDHRLSPTPQDLVAAAVASDVAWFARRFLRDHELDDDVSVSAWASTSEGVPTWCSLDVRVDVSEHAAAIERRLATALEERFSRAPDPPRIEVRSALDHRAPLRRRL